MSPDFLVLSGLSFISKDITRMASHRNLSKFLQGGGINILVIECISWLIHLLPEIKCFM